MIYNKISNTFLYKKNILNIYFTAGYPTIDSTLFIINILQKKNVDMIEIGIPYSDPIADGPTIQNSNNKALLNGMTTNILFKQLISFKKNLKIPIIIMVYYNQFISFGENKFLEKCLESGVSGLIIPDLSPELYSIKYKNIFKFYKLIPIFLISPSTPLERIIMINNISKGFLYLLSSSATTGSKNDFNKNQIFFFKKINSIKLSTPKLIGFGIYNRKNFDIACSFSNGAIIGSAFINYLINNNIKECINSFFKNFFK